MRYLDDEQRRVSTDSGAKVYIVKDDERLAWLLMNYLLRFDFEVRVVQTFEHIDKEVKEYRPHLILLDINLPCYDGFYWCKVIRYFSKVPIVFLSARTEDMDKISALERGGDDYLTKPFQSEVLLAKVRALLRRTYGEYSDGSHILLDQIVKNGIIVDTRRGQVSWQDNCQSLTTTELGLLRVLLEADGRTVTRDQLLSAVWDDVNFVDNNTLTVNITRLRGKLFDIGLSNVIATVRGAGYRFVLSRSARRMMGV